MGIFYARIGCQATENQGFRTAWGGVYAGVPAKYICSFEEFLEKRERYPEIRLGRNGKGGLSEETVQACWDRFYQLNCSEEKE